MKKQTTYTIRLTLWSLAILLTGSFLFTGCGEDDPVVEPKDYGSSKVTFYHVNTGLVNEVAFFRSDSIPVSSTHPMYEGTVNATVPNGENLSYSVKGLDGTVLASTTGSHDSSQFATVIFSGNANQKDLFIAKSEKIEVAEGNVAIRFVHAASDAGPRSLKIGSAAGAPVASGISYMGASDKYVLVGSDTKALVIVDETTSKPPITLTVDLSSGKVWTVVFHGTEAPVDEAYKWTGSLISDQQ